MNLKGEFRLRYGEGRGKRFERDFSLFKSGYNLGMSNLRFNDPEFNSYCPGCHGITRGSATCFTCGAGKVKE